MEKIALPSKINVEKGNSANESVISIQPCHPGFGTTLGNALRRVLLSSLPGSAIIAFKVKGATHEFTTVPNVSEDLVEIAMNLKQVRLRVHSNEPVELTIKAKGEKVVTAADIEATSDVEVVSKDAVIATLTSKDADFEMKLIVQQGRGYIPTEAREGEQLEVGMIAIDALYTPVQNVGFKVENVRVGQMTNFENLILNIETDGSITAAEALDQASQTLVDHLDFISNNVMDGKKATKKEEKEDK